MGLEIPVLRITNPNTPEDKKKVVLAVGRIHPGQTNGSIVLWGMVRRLLDPSSAVIRDKTIFMVVPMINPDGVVLGNSRTGVLGKDLNREYNSVDKELNPEVNHLKQFVSRIQRTHELHMFLDFHGHSQKKNCFVFGPDYPLSDLRYLKCKILPKLLSMRTEMFRYHGCTFKIPQDKMTTGRAVLFHDLKVPFTYTIETSNGFYYDKQTMMTYPFGEESWRQLGDHIGQTLECYFKYLAEYEEFLKAQREYRALKKMQLAEGRHMKKNVAASMRDLGVKPVQYARIMQQIRKDDGTSNQPWEVDEEEDLNSDCADDTEDLELLRRAELTKLMSEQPRIMLDKVSANHSKPPSTSDNVKRSRYSSGVRPFTAAISRSLKLNRVKEELPVKADIDTIEAEILEEIMDTAPRRSSSSQRRHSNIVYPTSNKAGRGCRLGGCNSTLSAQQQQSSQCNGYQPIDDSTMLFMKGFEWNSEKQLLSQRERKSEPVMKVVHPQRPIEIGKDIILPEHRLRSRTGVGFYGNDWGSKIKRRVLKREISCNSDVKLSADAQTRDILVHELDRVTQTIEGQSGTSNFSKLLKAASIPNSTQGLLGCRLTSFTIAGRPGSMMRTQRITSRNLKQRPMLAPDESSDFLLVRKYK